MNDGEFKYQQTDIFKLLLDGYELGLITDIEKKRLKGISLTQSL